MHAVPRTAANTGVRRGRTGWAPLGDTQVTNSAAIRGHDAEGVAVIRAIAHRVSGTFTPANLVSTAGSP